MKFEQDEVELTRRRAARAHAWAARSPSGSATPSGRSGRRSCPPTRSTAEVLAGQARNAPLTRPRPGPRRPRRHAEVRLRRRPAGAGAGQRPRDRGPGRARRGGPGVPAAGRSACEVLSHVVAIGAVERPDGVLPDARRRRPHRRRPGALRSTRRPARRWSPRSTTRSRTATPSAGSSRCVVYGLPPGLGSHVHWDRRLDSRLAAALMGIQAIKGVEVGDGFEIARTPRLAWRTTRSSAADGGSAGVTGRPAAPRAA